MGLFDYTTKEILNKVFRHGGGGSVLNLQSSTTQERLNAVFDSNNDALRVQMVGDTIKHQIFSHSFKDEPPANDDMYLSWSDAAETFSANSYHYFIAPYDMTLVKLEYSTDDIGTPFNLTVLVGKRGQTGVDTTLGNQTIAYTASDDHKVKTFDNLGGTITIPKGDKIYVTLLWSAKPKSGVTDHFITSVWTMDIST